MVDKEITYLKRRLQKARENNNLKDIYDYSCSLAACFTEIEEYDEALSLYNESLKASSKLGNYKDMAVANRMISETVLIMGNYDEALKQNDEYIKNAQLAADKVEEQRALFNKGRILYTHATYLSNLNSLQLKSIQNLLNECLDAYDKCYAVTQEIEVSENERNQMLARLYLNKGLAFFNLNDQERAINHFIKGAKICFKEKFMETGQMCYMNLGDVYIDKGSYKEAIEVYDKAFEWSSSLQLKTEAAYGKVMAYIGLNDLKKAKKILKSTYEMKATANTKKKLHHVVSLMKLETELCSVPENDFDTRKIIYKKMGELHYALKAYRNGIKCCLNSLECYQKTKSDPEDLSHCFKLICFGFKRVKEFDKALFYYNQEIAVVKLEPEDLCKTYYKIAKMHELNKADFEDICCAYEMARTKCNIFSKPELKVKCLKHLKRLSKEAHKPEITKSISKDLTATLNQLQDDSILLGSDCESQSEVTDSDTSFSELGSDSDFDIQEVLQESDDNGENIKKPRVRSKKTKYTIKVNEKGETLLHLAVLKGDIKKTRSLLDKGHPVNVRDAAGWTPLHEACNLGFVEIAELLIIRGADMNDKGGLSCEGLTPLHDAACNGKINVIEVLIKHGASLMILNNRGETPLQSLLKWKKSTALNEDELLAFKNVVKALKSPLDYCGSSVDQRSRLNTEKRVSDDKNKNSDTSSGLNQSSVPGTQKNSKSSSRKRLVSSEDYLQFNKSDECSNSKKYESEAFMLYKEAMENLRHRPKKFKSLSPKKNEPQPALIDENEYVENFIVGDDENEDDDDNESDENVEIYSNINGNDNNRKKINSSDYGDQDNVNNSSNNIDRTTMVKTTISTEKSNLSNMKPDEYCIENLNKKSDLSLKRQCERSILNSTKSVTASGQNSHTPQNHCMNIDVQNDLSLSSNDFDLSYPEVIPPKITSSESMYIDIQISDDTLRISVCETVIDNLKIDWLFHEVGKKYAEIKNPDFYVYLKSKTNSDISEFDPLKTILKEKVQLVMTRWKQFPLHERYIKACSKKYHIDLVSELSAFKYTLNPRVLEILKESYDSRKFNLENLKLSSVSLIPICKALKYEVCLKVLNLSNNYLGDKGLEVIVKMLNDCLIEDLNLSKCNITSAGIYRMSDLIHSVDLTIRKNVDKLNLSKNPITDDAVEPIINIIKSLPNLSVLHIEGCELGNKITGDFQKNLMIYQDDS